MPEPTADNKHSPDVAPGSGTAPLGDPGLAKTLLPTGNGGRGPLSDEMDGHTNERIGGLVMQQLFNRTPKTQKIGRYSVLDRIGRGGMGTVFSAYDEELDRKVAIKIISKGTESELASMRLKREAQAMARLSHPNVATVHEVGEAGGDVFVAMEFIRGQSLDAWILDEPGWRDVLEVFAQAGRGIIAAHEAGLIHRDLKPHNIMRTDSGIVKVLDFGLARVELSASDPNEDARDEDARVTSSASGGGGSPLDTDLTKTGSVMGTPAYMAPEQHRGEPTGVHSDQFSYCVALYEALYGSRPFESPTMGGLIHAITHLEPRPPPSESRVPTWVQRIVLRGLSRDPADRWPSMHALLVVLGRDPARSRRRWLTIAGLGLLTGVGGFAVSELRTPADEPCPTAGAETEALWPPERRDRIAAAFLGSDSPLAADTLARTAEPIGTYVDALGQMRSEACQAHREGRQSARVFDVRTACLDLRRVGFDQLLGAFENADGSTVQNAAWALASLPEVEGCGDIEALTAAVPPPEDDEIARQVKEQREVLASASALVLAGSYDEASAMARESLRRATAIGYEPLVAEAELVLGTALMESHQYEPAHEALSRSVRGALRSVHYEAAVEALARRMWIVADPLRRPTEALVNDEIADALLEHLGRPTGLHWLLLNNRGVAQFRNDAPEEAERSYRSALSTLGAEHDYPVELISTRYNLAMLLSSGFGWPSAAVGELQLARVQAIELLGPQHPRVVLLSNLLAEHLVTAGQPRQALEELEAGLDRLQPSDAYTRVLMLEELARIHDILRRYDLALESANEALALTEEHFPTDYLGTVALWHRGIARIGLGEVDSGITDLYDAIGREEKRSNPSQEFVAYAHSWAGYGLYHAGRLDEAVAELERVREHDEELDRSSIGVRSFTLVEVYLASGDLPKAQSLLKSIADAQDEANFSVKSRFRLTLSHREGDLSLARDDVPAALQAYEQACVGFANIYEPDHPDLAECRLSWARALASGEQALDLATRAAETYRVLGDGFAPDLAQAETLLASLTHNP